LTVYRTVVFYEALNAAAVAIQKTMPTIIEIEMMDVPDPSQGAHRSRTAPQRSSSG